MDDDKEKNDAPKNEDKEDDKDGKDKDKKDNDSDDNDGDGQDEDDDGLDNDEEAADKVMAGVKQSFNKVREAMQAAIKILKLIIKGIAKLIEAGPPGWIVLLVLVVVILVMVLVASFNEEESNGDQSGNRSTYDTQDLISDRSFTERALLWAARNQVRRELRKELGSKDYEEMRKGLLDYEDDLNVYDDHLWSYYNEDYGYQILNDEASQLLLPERLTYSYNHTDWQPTYDYDHELEDQISNLKAEIDANEGSWSKLKTQKKKQELEDLEVEEMKLELKVQRYKEINEMYWDYITENFIENEEVKSKEHPDGEPVEEKITAFYKDKYGVQTEDVESELNYYHTLMKRACIYERKISAPDGYKLEAFLKNPDWKKEDKLEEKDYGLAMADVESQFRVKYELLHHEAVLNSIKTDHIVNDVLMQSWSKQYLKDSLFAHMPIFEYWTYDKLVPVKTFNEYEMYDPGYWDGEGNYVDDGTFDSTIELYLRGGEYDIDYNDVAEAQYLTLQKKSYQEQIAEQGSDGKAADQILINELEIEIEKIDERLAELGDPDELNEQYKETFAKFLEASVYNKEGERVLNPHNHNVRLDTPEKEKTYLKYGPLMLDNYVEDTSILEVIMISVGGKGKRTEGPWKVSGFKGGKDSGTRTVTSTTTAHTVQTSLKPTKIRSILNSADYTYNKEEERSWKVEEKLDEIRPTIPWYEREVSYSESGGGTEYKHETPYAIHNWGKMVPHVSPWKTNEDMLLVDSTYLSDFYGKTQIISEETELVTDGLVDFDKYSHY